MDGWQLAADPDGIIAVGDLRGSGLTPNDVAALVKGEQLTALDRGWYCLGRPASLTCRHVLQTKAMLRSHGDRAVAGHHSALLLWGLATFRADLCTVRLTRRVPGPTRIRKGLKVGRSVPPEYQREITVSTALAVIQHGISAGPLSALVAADDALHRGMVTQVELQQAVNLVAGQPNTHLLGGFIELADGRRESPGETRLGHAFHLMRLAVTPQFEIRDGDFRAVADFKVNGVKVLVEFDGRVKYSRGEGEMDPFGNRRPAHEVLWAEKRREDRLRALGYEVVRVTWEDLDDLDALAARIGRAIAAARGRAA